MRNLGAWLECLTLVLVGCQQGASKYELPREVAEALDVMARQTSEGLDGASITVHRAYDYQGHTMLEPLEGEKLIAVDVEFKGYAEVFDLDDVSRKCANLSWKLKRLQTLWFDDVGKQHQAARERSRDGKSATYGEEMQEVASFG